MFSWKFLHYWSLFIAFVLCPGLGLVANAAEDLKLKEGISFNQDLDSGFPIIGEKMDDVVLEAGKPTLIFFGAAGDLNTNRQAKRLIDLYKHYRASGLKFMVVDVDHASHPSVRQLIKERYQGYIPSQILLNKDGKATWSQIGEIDLHVVENQIKKLL